MLKLATERGVRVAWRDLGRRHGEYHSTGLILLNPRRSTTMQRVTLAHELGHAHYGHTWTGDAVLHARHERVADEYAAELLIRSRDYALAERIAGPHLGGLARELGVTTRIVEAWQRQAERTRRIA